MVFELTCVCITYLFFYFLVIKEGVWKLLGKIQNQVCSNVNGCGMTWKEIRPVCAMVFLASGFCLNVTYL